MPPNRKTTAASSGALHARRRLHLSSLCALIGAVFRVDCVKVVSDGADLIRGDHNARLASEGDNALNMT